jgi:hypothetical protein
VFTTSYARLKLYEAMEGVGDPKRILYCDTDSLVYTHRPSENKLIRGDYLGDLTDELKKDEKEIIEFVSGGPKNYGYTTRKNDGGVRHHLKIKGFSLDKRSTKELLNYMSMREVVLGVRENVEVPDRGIKRTKKRRIVNRKFGEDEFGKRHGFKVYGLTGDKRVFGDDYKSVPYGWRGE